MFRSEDGKTIWELMEEARAEDAPPMKASKFAAAAYFWIVTSTTPFIFIAYVIPTEFRNDSEEKRYWMKILTIWLALQCMANWLCCRFTATHLIGTKDKAVVNKSLWKDDENGGDYTKDPNYCKICKLIAPYGSKTHHCVVCNKCIMRRDHHCFLLGTCVGYYNQRFFAVLTFYMGISSAMCFYYFRRYLMNEIESRDDFYWTEYILPLTLKHLLIRRISLLEFTLVSYCYTFVMMGFMGCGFFTMQMHITFYGQTWHEFNSGKKVRAYRTVFENFREVFGPYCLANFVMPMQLVFRQQEIEQPLMLLNEDEKVNEPSANEEVNDNANSHVSINIENLV
ncbi:putative ZDHHC-type palmitoyltransferase 2 [Watersipora subatra]|uniref:putative ZDHHC-type palmitoyltransferase 2 n=1 Tax=Watersipora subatra TaxID=2589382 RepID=UPI00355B5B3D